MENISGTHTTQYKKKRKTTTKKTPNLVNKWAEDLNRHLPVQTYRQPTDTWKDAQHP